MLLPVVAVMVVALDIWFKRLALDRLPHEGSLSNPGFIELAIHKNYGIAFNIPFRLSIVLLVTAVLCAVLLHMARQTRISHPLVSASALSIVLGAIGNAIDRATLGFTVDYIILFGRSAINLADLVILSGVIGLLVFGRKAHRTQRKPIVH